MLAITLKIKENKLENQCYKFSKMEYQKFNICMFFYILEFTNIKNDG